jgi:hypothetical protein
MASKTFAQAAYLAQSDLAADICDMYITIDTLMNYIPIFGCTGVVYIYNRQASDPKTTVGYLAVNGTMIASQTAPSLVTVNIDRILGDAEVDTLTSFADNVQDQMDIAVSQKIKGLARLFSEYFITGTGSSQLYGINTLVDSTNQWIAAGSTTSGGSLTLDLLEQLADKTTIPGGLKCYIMGNVMKRKYKALYRALYFGSPDLVEMGSINPLTGERRNQYILGFDGLPIFINDNCSTETTYGASAKYRVSCAVLDEDDGLHLVAPKVLVPYGGIYIQPERQKDTVDANARKCGQYIATALKSTKALSQVVNLIST